MTEPEEEKEWERLLTWFVKNRQDIKDTFGLDHLIIRPGRDNVEAELEFHIKGDFRQGANGKPEPIIYRTECRWRFKSALKP